MEEMTGEKIPSGYDPDQALRLENQLCFPLYAAARKVVNAYTPYLKPLGLTYTQYLVFLVLWEHDGKKRAGADGGTDRKICGEEPEDLTVGEIGQILYLDNGTLTPMLKKLEAAGLIERSRKARDERVVQVSLTEKGRLLKERAAEVPPAVAGCMPLDIGEAESLYRSLYRILAAKDA